MKFYTGWQWLLIDAASKFGLDKLLFEQRIEWAEENLDKLEQLKGDKKEEPLYKKAVMAIRKAQQGIPTGHLVGIDAVCSGVQVMSVMTGCERGANATGLIDPNRRADAYTDVTNEMSNYLGPNFSVSRADAKYGTMTFYYGSRRTPEAIFGEDSPELKAFYAASEVVAPGAFHLRHILKEAWQPFALEHSWKLPDGYDARVKVMKKITSRIEVQELEGASFTYEYYENEGEPYGLSLIANVTHSMDAYVLRCMHRRCNYDKEIVQRARDFIQAELIARHLNHEGNDTAPHGKVAYYLQQYERSGIADVVILPHLTQESVEWLSTAHLHKLMDLINGMLQYEPFPIVTVHDEFKCHANNVNWMRWQYKEIMADIADSHVLDDLLTQIFGTPCKFEKLSHNLGDKIRNSEYGLC